MAAETDVKTKKGILVALKKLEEIRGTLGDIDPEHSAFHAPLRLCRALIAASISAVYHLLSAIVALSEGDEMPAQLTIPDLLTKTARKVPEVTGEDRDAIRAAAESDDDDDTASGEDPGPAAVTDLLLQVQSHRSWNDHITGGWTAADRVAVAAWARATIDGDDLPVPELVSARYLEDLDLEDNVDDRVLLMSWVNITVDPEVDWSVDLWSETTDWASAIHRHDRGLDLEIPPVPAHMLPPGELFGLIKNMVFQSEGTTTGRGVREHFGSEHFGVMIALGTLVELGDIVEDDGTLAAESPHVDWSLEALETAAKNVGRKLPAKDDAESADNVVDFLRPDDEGDDTGEAEISDETDDDGAQAGDEAEPEAAAEALDDDQPTEGAPENA